MSNGQDGIGISEIEETRKRYDGETWLCAVCSVKRFPLGKRKCKGPAECGNPATITGAAYVDEDGYIKK